MRTSQSLSKLFAAFSVAVAVVMGTSVYAAQSGSQGTAIATSIKGTVKYSTPGGPWLPLTDKTELPTGATVQTVAGSVVLVFNGKDGIRLGDNTTVEIDKLAKISGDDSDVSLNLQGGTIVGQVKKISKASHFDIRTPTGVAGIRGTDFAVSVKALDGGKYEVTYSCLQGVVVVATRNADGSITTKTLSDRMTITFGAGEPVVVQLTDAQIAALDAFLSEITTAIIDISIATGITSFGISVGNPINIASPTVTR